MNGPKLPMTVGLLGVILGPYLQTITRNLKPDPALTKRQRPIPTYKLMETLSLFKSSVKWYPGEY